MKRVSPCASLVLTLSSHVGASDRPPNIPFILANDQAPQTLSAGGSVVCRALLAEPIHVDDPYRLWGQPRQETLK